MFSANLITVILITFNISIVFSETLNENSTQNASNETGRFFENVFFSVFDFVDNLMVKNQEKLTRQATTTTPNPMTMMDLVMNKQQFSQMQVIEAPDTPTNSFVYLWNKFKEKIDILLLSKVLLRLIVFKKLVKFLALIGLLFYLPTLKQDQTGRIFRDDYDYDVNNQSNFVR